MKDDNRSKANIESPGRRSFLRIGGACAALTATPVLSTLLNLQLTKTALAATSGIDDYKALVCVFLFGGNDSYNMLVPNEDLGYSEYAATRSNLALPRNDLLPITDPALNPGAFGIHPGMPEVRDLYNSQNLAFLANTGSLIEPTTRGQYDVGTNLPVGLFSHADEQRHWQTTVPQSRSQITGWAGRMADHLTDQVNANPDVAMNIAVGKLNIWQTGDVVVPYVIDRNSGAEKLNSYNHAIDCAGSGGNAWDRILTCATDSLLSQTYSDLLKKTHAGFRRNAIDAAVEFIEAIEGVSLSTAFPDSFLGSQLKMVARTIGARAALGHQKRQIFFVFQGGFDSHAQLLTSQGALLRQVSQALGAFYDATVELKVSNAVTTFTASDFARTNTSNGNGSDHAWGGNHMIVGGAVNGGGVYGQYPSLALKTDLEIGRGRLIPTTSVDQYAAELALWFGMQNDSSLEAMLPNIRNFYMAGATEAPIGFMSPLTV